MKCAWTRGTELSLRGMELSLRGMELSLSGMELSSAVPVRTTASWLLLSACFFTTKSMNRNHIVVQLISEIRTFFHGSCSVILSCCTEKMFFMGSVRMCSIRNTEIAKSLTPSFSLDCDLNTWLSHHFRAGCSENHAASFSS